MIVHVMIAHTGYAQEILVVSGQVTDSRGNQVNAGSVSLLLAGDSSLVKFAQIDAGLFSCGPVKAGDYLLKISSIGFEEKVMHLKHSGNENLMIILKDNGNVLKEVQVTAAKKMFSNTNGNIKLNVENSILSSVPNTVDLLAKLPAVQVSSDGEKLSIVGRGEPLIYLDNQRVKMEDLVSLSTNDIKTIELVNNPSAKYEAEGRSVILITRKANKKEGIKIDLTETASVKKYFQNRTGVNVSLKKDKLEFRYNMQYNYLNLWESNGNDFRIADKNLVSDYTVTSIGLRKQAVIGGGIYYQINGDDYLSFNASKRFQNENFTIATSSFLKQPSVDENAITQNFNQETRPFFNSNLNYNRKFKELNAQLFIGGQYSRFTQQINSEISNNYNDTEYLLSQNRQQSYLIDVLTGRADFEKSFKNEMKLELGANVSGASSKSLLNIQNYSPQNQSASDYNYAEQIWSAYTQLSGKISKISYSAGLRMENTRVQGGYQDSLVLAVSRNYTKLFPKASVNIPLGETKTVTLGYSKSITRPNYSSSSQITTYINPFFEWANNINISPSITQEISATVQYKESSWGVSYYRINNPVYYSTEYNDQTSTLRMIDKNYALESGVNMNVTVPFKYRGWTSTNTLVVTKDQITDPASVTGKSDPYLYFYSNNEFKLPGGYGFMVSGWGITKRNEGIFERNAMMAVDTTVTKTFFKKLTCSLSYKSIISTGQAKENFNVNDVVSKGVYYLNNREVALSLKYAFGKLKDSKYKNRDVNDDLNRIK